MEAHTGEAVQRPGLLQSQAEPRACRHPCAHPVPPGSSGSRQPSEASLPTQQELLQAVAKDSSPGPLLLLDTPPVQSPSHDRFWYLWGPAHLGQLCLQAFWMGMTGACGGQHRGEEPSVRPVSSRHMGCVPEQLPGLCRQLPAQLCPTCPRQASQEQQEALGMPATETPSPPRGWAASPGVRLGRLGSGEVIGRPYQCGWTEEAVLGPGLPQRKEAGEDHLGPFQVLEGPSVYRQTVSPGHGLHVAWPLHRKPLPWRISQLGWGRDACRKPRCPGLPSLVQEAGQGTLVHWPKSGHSGPHPL